MFANKLILIAGASGSGKSTIAAQLVKHFQENEIQIICLDQFYRPQNKLANYDHPKSFDWQLLTSCIQSLLQNHTTKIPSYDYKIHDRGLWKDVQPSKIIILEGILALHNLKLNKLATMKIFVDTPADECLIRRMLRDIKERKRTIDSVIHQWRTTVKPMYNQFCLSQADDADVIIPWMRNNDAALKMLYNNVFKMVINQEEKKND